MVKSRTPVAVLLDLMLPGIDGLTIIKRLQESPATRDIPVAVVSAYADAGDTRKVLDAAPNVKKVFVKPVLTEDLLNSVKRMIDGAVRIFLRSKIHNATVTDANRDYVGSLTIDPDLMEKADIAEHEKVLVADNTNGARLETYVIKGPSGLRRYLRQRRRQPFDQKRPPGHHHDLCSRSPRAPVQNSVGGPPQPIR
jgi:CheY-like chemotaxis protein